MSARKLHVCLVCLNMHEVNLMHVQMSNCNKNLRIEIWGCHNFISILASYTGRLHVTIHSEPLQAACASLGFDMPTNKKRSTERWFGNRAPYAEAAWLLYCPGYLPQSHTAERKWQSNQWEDFTQHQKCRELPSTVQISSPIGIGMHHLSKALSQQITLNIYQCLRAVWLIWHCMIYGKHHITIHVQTHNSVSTWRLKMAMRRTKKLASFKRQQVASHHLQIWVVRARFRKTTAYVCIDAIDRTFSNLPFRHTHAISDVSWRMPIKFAGHYYKLRILLYAACHWWKFEKPACALLQLLQ